MLADVRAVLADVRAVLVVRAGTLGPLMGGPQCRMSILRNGNVACLCRLFMAMSHVEFKKKACRMSLYF